MLAIIYVFLGLIAMGTLVSPNADDNSMRLAAAQAIAGDMVYYHSEAESRCFLADSENVNDVPTMTCPAGTLQKIPNRQGAVQQLDYGQGIQSWTDGETYVATTICGTSIGKVDVSNVYGYLTNAILQSGEDPHSVGYYYGGVVKMNSNGLQQATDTVYQQTYPVTNAPCSLQNGQPVLYTKLRTSY